MKHCCCIPLLTLKIYIFCVLRYHLCCLAHCTNSLPRNSWIFFIASMATKNGLVLKKKSTGLLRAHIRAHMYKIEKDLCGTNFTKKIHNVHHANNTQPISLMWTILEMVNIVAQLWWISKLKYPSNWRGTSKHINHPQCSANHNIFQ